MKTAISVIIPIYHSDEFLEECLNSLRNQDFAMPFKVLMIDCKSDDDSSDIAKRFQYEDSRFYYFRYEINLGPGFSRNLGVGHATSEYVTFVDADDVLSKDYLSLLYKNACATKADIITGGYCILKNGKLKNGYSRKKFIGKGKKALLGIYKDKTIKFRTFCWGRLYRLDFLKENRVLFDTELHMFEDWLFVSKAMFHANKVCFFKKGIYYYRQRNNSIMGHSFDRVDQHLLALKKTKEYLDSQDSAFSAKIHKKLSLPIKMQLRFDAIMDKSVTQKETIKKAKMIYKEGTKHEPKGN